MERSLVQLTALLVFGIVVGNAYADEPERVVGGTDAHEGEFPYQVSLRVYDYHICGGTIISPRHILTAAHCIEGTVFPPYADFTVVSGSVSLSKGGQTHQVVQIQMPNGYVPPNQRNSWKYDVAIITLAAPMTFNRFQQPIAVATVDPPVHAKLTLSGWGLVNNDGDSPDILQKTNMYYITNSDCQSHYPGQPIHPTHLCGTRHAGIGACSGDSGGPVVYNNQLVGVVSWVIPCAHDFPDVFARVTSFVPFINSVTGLH